MTKIHGNGVVFLSGGGTIVQKALQPGEKYVLDTPSFMAAESSVSIGVRCAGGIKMACCGGKGIFNTELTGCVRNPSECVHVTVFLLHLLDRCMFVQGVRR